MSEDADAINGARFQGRRQGGLARAESLTPERRRQIAAKAAQTRWQAVKDGQAPVRRSSPGQAASGPSLRAADPAVTSTQTPTQERPNLDWDAYHCFGSFLVS